MLKNKRKILVIIPGFGETTNDKPYQEIIKTGKKAGFKISPFDPGWDRRTTDHWLADLMDLLNRHTGEDITIVGFSLGAYLALLASAKVKFSKLIICSPAPFFSEDLPNLPPIAKKVLGAKRFKVFAKYSRPKNIEARALFLVGDAEYPIAIEETKSLAKNWTGKSRVKVLTGVEHDIGIPKYLEEVLKEISRD